MTTNLEFLTQALVEASWPKAEDGSLYFNAGSCGRKPKQVEEAVKAGWQRLNHNPSLFTYGDAPILESTRQAAAALLNAPAQSLVLVNNTSHGLQTAIQSFLSKAGDHVVYCSHEHGSSKAMVRYLQEACRISASEYKIGEQEDSFSLCQGMLQLVQDQTKLVVISEIFSPTGWRPHLDELVTALKVKNIPLLVDGSHAPGQIVCQPTKYPLWVGAGHKWLGGPNGTGFLYVAPHLVDQLKPVILGDRYFNKYENPLHRLEWAGTSDMTRWLGLEAACRLNLELGCEAIAKRHVELQKYLRMALQPFTNRDSTNIQLPKFASPNSPVPKCEILTPNRNGEFAGMLTLWFPDARGTAEEFVLKMWEERKIYIAPIPVPGFLPTERNGITVRVSCHISTGEADIDALVESLIHYLG